MSSAAVVGYQFKLEDFEGPLDLLLFLIRKNEINVYDIPIASITEQYLNFLSLTTSLDLEMATEFYQMAATLLYIKSRTLLPSPMNEEEEWEDPRRELIDKLLEYQKYKKLSELMAEQESDGSNWIFERKKIQPVLPFDRTDEFWEKIEVWDLFRTFSQIMKGLSPERIFNLFEEVSVNEKVTLIHEFLQEKEMFLFTDLILRADSMMEIVCAFLAVLELVKTRTIILFQSRLFGDIQIRKKENFDG